MKLALKTVLAAAGVLAVIAGAAPATAQSRAQSWQARLSSALPLLGHRNWILVVDSAYPLQVSPGIEIVETHTGMADVLRTVLTDLNHSIQATPIIYTDAELPFVPENEVPGVNTWRRELKEILGNRPAHSLLHEKLLEKTSEVAKTYRILVLKTTSVVPYSSVFLELGPKYWSPADEQQLRTRMDAAGR